MLLARVHYDVPPAAAPGTVPLTLSFTALYDTTFTELGSCVPIVTTEAICVPASITLVLPPPSIEKQPEGNAANADLAVPQGQPVDLRDPGPCAGPGEGALRVVRTCLRCPGRPRRLRVHG